jgi:hypothetical protein
MAQTVLSVVLEVVPESADRLSEIIEIIKQDEERRRAGATESYSRLKQGAPSLHFMSMSVFRGADYDPIFVIEANFDGKPGPFWAQIEETLGSNLRLMLRCCKRPADSSGPLYDAVTAPGATYPVAAYLERRTLTPSVFHQGNRGMTRDRILAEAELFLATRAELAQDQPNIPNPYRGIPSEAIHARLRTALMPAFPWLDAPAPVRISTAEKIGDLLRLFGLLGVVVFCQSIPGLVLAPLLTAGEFVILFAIAAMVVVALLWRIRSPRSGEAAPRRSGGLGLSTLRKPTSGGHPLGFLLRLAGFVIADVLAASLVIMIVSLLLSSLAGSVAGVRFDVRWWSIARAVALGLASLVFVLPAVVLWLRLLERRDSSHDAPLIDWRELRKMTRREDWVPQNHMGSVVLVKPGVLRMLLFRAGHLALGYLLRVVATDGYLGSMRTVHFAHWAFVNNSSRLMFFSNFDHSWDSYLDDFIEKAHGGLTLAWGSGVGFPPTRFLVLDGASHGRQFKAWARHSMAVSRFWFSAYKDLTVDQIERNARIADGLRKATLSSTEAAAWTRDL